ncbi:thioesterase domain-containing protein, partial [Streptomyces sp. NPDC001193]
TAPETSGLSRRPVARSRRRADGQVKVRGHRMELGEIESALARHPRVLAAAVAVHGTGVDAVLAGYVTWRDEEGDVRELGDFLRQDLPEYMVPAVLTALERLPLTPNGKLDRKALPAPSADAARGDGAGRIAPRDTTELRMARLWEQTLGTAPIGVRDDFFALGGHSLKAFALMAAVRREFGVELPLNLVFRRRTVELLCEALPDAGAAAARLLVPLADGNPSRPPLVLVHPRGGDVVCYRDLVRDLSARPGGDRRILGLESVGYNTGERPLETVPEMAERYLDALREEQPHGPYLLAGWSFGGTVAYEMAARLEAAGEEVAFLGLIDAAAPGAAPGNRSGTAAGPGDPDLLRYGIAAGIDADSARELDEEELLDVLVRRGRAEGTLPRTAPTEALRRVLRVAEANGAASAAYRTDAVLVVGLHLFTVDERHPELGTPLVDPAAWHARTAGDVLRAAVPGNHHDLVDPPHCAALAELLAAALPS